MKNILQASSLILFFTMVVGCQKVTSETDSETLPEKLIDRIQLVDLKGNQISLDSFKGKTILLNYWATWCRPCLAEMPDLDEAALILGKENFIFLAASDESVEKIKNFAAKYQYSFQFVHSSTSVFDLDIMALPTTMIINKKGDIVYNKVGARDWSSKKEIEILRKIAEQ